MGEIIFKIWYFIAILPFLIVSKGYEMFKEFLKKNNYTLDWMYVLLAILVILLIIASLLKYGYN